MDRTRRSHARMPPRGSATEPGAASMSEGGAAPCRQHHRSTTTPHRRWARPADGARCRPDRRSGTGRPPAPIARSYIERLGAGLSHGADRIFDHPPPDEIQHVGAGVEVALARRLHRQPAAELRVQPPLPSRPDPSAPAHPDRRQRGCGDDGHLSHRLGSGPGAGLCVLGAGEHRGGRIAGLAHHGLVEPRRHCRRAGRHLATLGPVVPLDVAGQCAGVDGSRRPSLCHPHGGCGDGAEGDGRELDAAERGPVPLVDPELLRRDHGGRRGGAPLVRQPGSHPTARVRAVRAGRTAGHRNRPCR